MIGYMARIRATRLELIEARQALISAWWREHTHREQQNPFSGEPMSESCLSATAVAADRYDWARTSARILCDEIRPLIERDRTGVILQ